MADEFEYQAVPKFIDFQNENEDFEKSAFFKGDNLIQPSPHPQRNADSRCPDAESNDRILAPVDGVSSPLKRRSVRVINGEKATSGAPAPPVKASSSAPLKSRPVRVTNGEKAATSAPAPPIKASSNLALFNHGASRIAEKARRRSQQIQAPPENPPKERSRAVPFTQILRSYKPPTGTTPSKPLTKPNPFPLRRSTSRCRDTQANIDPRIRASVDRLSTPLKSSSVRATNGEKATTGAPAPLIKASSSAPLKSRPVRVTNGEKAATSAPAPPIKASSNLALFNHGASRIAEKARRRSQQIQAPPENPPKERSRAVPFTQILRSYKPPTGTTPSKPLTKPNPFPLRRSTSRCRDTQANIDPRIRASVDRLSTPLKSSSVRATNGEKATTGAPAPLIKASSSTPLKSRPLRETNGEKSATGAPAPLIKASSNLALFNHGASRIAEKARRRSQQIQAPPENPSKERSRAVPFTQILRSYNPPTGTTPSKPLTKPNPFPLRRSTSRCRDTQANIDPRIRASVDRLSTPRIRAPVDRLSAPRKRENLRSMK